MYKELRIMGNVIWLIIMIPTSALFTGIGIYAIRRKKPMWFWSGSTVKEYEISDIPAYNKANGIMWIGFSMIFWISAILGFFKMPAGGYFLIAGCIFGIPLLPAIYHKIYQKYRR